MVGDLPKGVIQQWRAWCMHPEYMVGVVPDARARFAAIRTPMTTFSFTDDEMMSERSTRVLENFYTNSPLTALRFQPQELGLRRVGHFGFFRAQMSAPLWDACVPAAGPPLLWPPLAQGAQEGLLADPLLRAQPAPPPRRPL